MQCHLLLINGFKGTGVYPFNREVFNDSDFLSPFVTDRPNPNNVMDNTNTEQENAGVDDPVSLVYEKPSTPKKNYKNANPASASDIVIPKSSTAPDGILTITPEYVPPHPRSWREKEKY